MSSLQPAKPEKNPTALEPSDPHPGWHNAAGQRNMGLEITREHPVPGGVVQLPSIVGHQSRSPGQQLRTWVPALQSAADGGGREPGEEPNSLLNFCSNPNKGPAASCAASCD